MIGSIPPCQYRLLVAGDLPFVVDTYRPTNAKGSGMHLRCLGLRAEDAGTVTVTMKAPGEAAAQTHELPVNTTSGMEWLGDIKSVTAFNTTTKVWLYLTDVFSD